MSIPRDKKYVYDHTSTAYGAQIGETIRYVLKNGGTSYFNNFSNLDGLYTFRYSNVYQPGVIGCVGKRLDKPVETLTDMCEPHNYGSIGIILTSNAAGQSYYSAYNRIFYNSATQRNILTGQTTALSINQNVAPQANIITGGFDLSKYFLVPQITARKPLTTQTITAPDWKTYINQYAADYPHITGITGRIYYKASLESTSQAQATGINLCGSRRYYGNLNWICPSAPKVNQYTDILQTENLAAIGMDIYRPPMVNEVYVMYSMGTPYYRNSLCMYDGIQSTHSPAIQNLGYVNPSGGSPGNTPRNPYVYITQTTARAIINSLGFWVADSIADTADAHGVNTVSEHIFMPQIDSNGIPTGEGWTGGGGSIDESPININWNPQQELFPTGGGIDTIAFTPINPNLPVNRTGETNTKPIDFGTEELLPTTPTINGLGVFANYYAMSSAQVLALSDFLWNSDETIITDIINSLKLFGQNPINAIMSLRLYPFNVGSLVPSIVTENIVLGRVDTGVTALKIPNNAGTTIDLGSLYIDGHFNDFRDYSPYTSYNLYIPFIGTVNLNPNDYLYHKVNLKMVIDITSGKATAIIYADGIPMQYLDGMIGVEIPITGENMGQTVNAIIGAVGSTAAAAMTGGGIGAAMAAVSGAADIVFNDVSINKTGNVSPAACLSMPINAYLVISRPTSVIPENYGHTKGYACDMTALLSSLSGYTVCYNVDTTGISATETERNELKTLLESGVYL